MVWRPVGRSLPTPGVDGRCKEILEWNGRFRLWNENEMVENPMMQDGEKSSISSYLG